MYPHYFSNLISIVVPSLFHSDQMPLHLLPELLPAFCVGDWCSVNFPEVVSCPLMYMIVDHVHYKCVLTVDMDLAGLVQAA